MISRYTDPARKAAAQRRLTSLARLLDNAVVVPGTQYRVGVDALLGLVPGVGDALTTALSGYIVLEAYKLGARPGTLAVMIGNVTIDSLMGAVPGLGDVGDIFFKANARNIRLLQQEGVLPPGSSEQAATTPPAEAPREPAPSRKHVVNVAPAIA